jgi:hypothetical protein
MVPNARFTELLADIEPSSTTKSNASSAHNGIRDYLCDHEDFAERWRDDFLAGSYARDTAIRPRNGSDGQDRPDVDIIVVTNFSTSDDPESVLNELSRALDDEYEVERINKRSVRVVTTQAEMDIVPVIESGTSYLLPDRDLGRWKATNPPAHTTWSSQQNEASGGRFKKLVKLMKWWRRENPTSKRPKGFALEILVANHAPKTEAHFGEAFAKMLESIYAQHGALAEAGYKPTIADPGLPGSDILDKVTVPQWKAFMEKVRVHAEFARRAQKEEDMEEATRLWRRVFGDRFPRTETAAKSVSMASRTVAPAAAAAGYTFPDAMAAPNKPRGFA